MGRRRDSVEEREQAQGAERKAADVVAATEPLTKPDICLLESLA